jgi:dGTP triphosphohydrolase
MVSSWLMSASVTAYNVTAFEVAVLFKQNRRYGLTFVFVTLWVTVTLFSMATAVSVFYDRFNFNEYQVAEENKESDSHKLELELLRTKETDLRDSITFKKQDIEYRQEHDYATTAVRLELEALQKELQENLSEQQRLLSETPEVVQEVTKRKERLFAFLGRMLHVDSGIFEFAMSTLSAIFVNLIAPLSLVAVAELKKKKLTK